MALSTYVGKIVTVAFILASFTQGLPACVDDRQCGWNAQCWQGQCRCLTSYSWSHNNRDCIDSGCDDSRCLDCVVASKCRRCVDFIEEGTGRCVDTCTGNYMLVVDGDLVGRVCPVRTDSMMTVYIAIIVGVGAGILLTAALSIGFYFKMRKNRNKKLEKAVVNKIVREQTQKQFPQRFEQKSYDNHGYDVDMGDEKRREDTSTFYSQVSALRPYTDSLMSMITEAKERNRSLPPQDTRAYVYKNIIHQLCRVVTLLSADDRQINIPADGTALLTWADKILKKYLTAQGENLDYGSHAGTVKRHSTFKPDHRLIPNGHAIASNNAHGSAAFTYERCDSEENLEHMINRETNLDNVVLQDTFTDPIDV